MLHKMLGTIFFIFLSKSSIKNPSGVCAHTRRGNRSWSWLHISDIHHVGDSTRQLDYISGVLSATACESIQNT